MNIYILWALCFIAGLGATTYLAVMDHPWFALFILLVVTGLRVRSEEKAGLKLGDE